MIKEYHNSNVILYELGGSFADSFNDCLRQVKDFFLDLDLYHISIDAQSQTLAYPIDQEDTDEQFADETTPDLQDDGETTSPED